MSKCNTPKKYSFKKYKYFYIINKNIVLKNIINITYIIL